MIRFAILVLAVGACGSKSNSDLDARCEKYAAHIIEMTMQGSTRAEGEEAVLEQARKGAAAACKSEKLSQATTDCVIATHGEDWGKQMMKCPGLEKLAEQARQMEEQDRNAGSGAGSAAPPAP